MKHKVILLFAVLAIPLAASAQALPFSCTNEDGHVTCVPLAPPKQNVDPHPTRLTPPTPQVTPHVALGPAMKIPQPAESDIRIPAPVPAPQPPAQDDSGDVRFHNPFRSSDNPNAVPAGAGALYGIGQAARASRARRDAAKAERQNEA